MKDLVTITTRITKDLKEKVKDFSRNNNVKTQIIYKVALNDFLERYSSEERKSETTLFLEKQLEKAHSDTNSKAHELLDEIIIYLDENKIELTEVIKELIVEYKDFSSKEIAALDFWEESLK